MAGALLGHDSILPDAVQVEVRFAVRALEEVNVVGRDDGQPQALRRFDQHPVDHALLGEAVVLQLDEARSGLEHLPQLDQDLLAVIGSLLQDALRGHAAQAAREADEALGASANVVERHARRAVAGGADVAPRDQAHQVGVPLVGRRQHHQMLDHAPALGTRDVELGAQDGLDACLPALGVVADGTEHVGVVGDRHGLHAVRHRALDERPDLHGARQERELSVNVQVDELCAHASVCSTTPRWRRGLREPTYTRPHRTARASALAKAIFPARMPRASGVKSDRRPRDPARSHQEESPHASTSTLCASHRRSRRLSVSRRVRR